MERVIVDPGTSTDISTPVCGLRDHPHKSRTKGRTGRDTCPQVISRLNDKRSAIRYRG